jgi:2-polyprenyl-6-methoxyphenol hydroxylase-like FAD-dependent oxidoreductase
MRPVSRRATPSHLRFPEIRMKRKDLDVVIVGGGIGGVTLGLMLHRAGIRSRIFEAVAEMKPLGVGINILPHSSRELAALGLEPALAARAVTTRESAFYNRYGQLIYAEPTGRFAGYEWPQFSIHRGDLHTVLLDAFAERVGRENLHTGWRCAGVEQDDAGATVRFENGRPPQRADIVIDCEGIHSVVRKQLYPHEGKPRYSGINMWRGVTRGKPFLSGATMVRLGWFDTAKMLIYPIRDDIDQDGNQLINWVVDVETPRYLERRDWNRPGRIEDFFDRIADWKFDWLDVPELCRRADFILEFPMVDQDPLPRWSFDRLTLLGDAAHPMYPRGANGSAQAILDARMLADCLATMADPVAALKAYEAQRLPVTSKIVLTNRESPPDAILKEVWRRTGDKPFARIDDVISRQELVALSRSYERVAGYDKETLAAGAAAVP